MTNLVVEILPQALVGVSPHCHHDMAAGDSPAPAIVGKDNGVFDNVLQVKFHVELEVGHDIVLDPGNSCPHGQPSNCPARHLQLWLLGPQQAQATGHILLPVCEPVQIQG